MDYQPIYLPRKIVIKSGAVRDVPAVLKDLGIAGPVAVMAGDKKTWGLAGESVVEDLVDAGFAAQGHTVKRASTAEVKEAEETIEKRNSKVVIGVGGGTVIDVAKVASFNKNAFFVSVPTIASHDGIASNRASIPETDHRPSYSARAPIAIVADLDIIGGAPYPYLAAGCADLLAKRTAVRDWQQAHLIRGEAYDAYAAALAAITADRIIAEREAIVRQEPRAVEMIIKSLIASSMAMCIANSSRPASGAEHLFSHELDRAGRSPALHGEQVGVGAIIMAYLQPERDWREIRDTLREIKAPTTADELRVTPTEVINALLKCHRIRPERHTILGTEGLTKEAAVEAARVTGVIRRDSQV